MQRVTCLTLLATLLVFMVGCGMHGHRSMGESFQVDGVSWSMRCVGFLNSQDGVDGTWLLLYPVDGGSFSIASGPGRAWRVNTEKIHAKFVPKSDTLYLLQDGKTIEIGYDDLGIDSELLKAKMNTPFDKDTLFGEDTTLNTARATMFNYLRPILETLIREHINTQEEKE